MRSISDAISCNAAFCVVNLGCKVNRVESDAIAAALAQAGCLSVPEHEAQLIVVNTCTVTGEADKKARKAVRHALSSAPEALVVVTGCAVAVDARTYEELDERVLVMQRADLLLSLAQVGGDRPLRMGDGFNTRVSLKIQDGCNRACTYCIVHVARGPARSVPADEVLEEAERYLRRGVNELVLAGIDLGSYRSGGEGLADLVERLLEAADRAAVPGEPPARIRASSLEPHSIDERFIGLLASSQGRLCRHLHLPLQSGHTKVLREMGRPYTAERFAELVEQLYAQVPGLSLTTDIIAGFPGETDQEFEGTLELARACRFSKIHVFPYSLRAGTPAAARTDQVPAEVKARRSAELRALSDELRTADLRRRAGTTELVLVEGTSALTESYHEVPVPSGARAGELVAYRFPE